MLESLHHHIAAMHDHEREARVTIDARARPGSIDREIDLSWRRGRIEGHAVRALVALLSLLASDAPRYAVRTGAGRLEGVFNDADDANGYAGELNAIGAFGVYVAPCAP